jgi:hypothetical protein
MDKKPVMLEHPNESEDKVVSDDTDAMGEDLDVEKSSENDMSVPRKLWYTLRSRQRWKNKSQAKQKKIRELETKVRDLSQSRDRWKEKAESVTRSIQLLKAELASSQTNERDEPDVGFSKKS